MSRAIIDIVEVVAAFILLVYAGPALASAGYSLLSHVAVAVGTSLVLNGVPDELVLHG